MFVPFYLIDEFSERLPRRKFDGCDLMMTYFNYLIIPVAFVLLGIFLENTNDARYFFSLVPSENKSVWTVILYVVLEFWGGLSLFSNFYFYWYLALVYVVSTNFCLKFLTR